MKRASETTPPSGAGTAAPKRTKLILPKGVTMDNPAIRSALEKLMLSNPGANVVRVVKVAKSLASPRAHVVAPTPVPVPPPPPAIPEKPKVVDDVAAISKAVAKRVLEDLETKNTRLKEVNRQLEEKTKIVKEKIEKLESKVGKFLSPADDPPTGHVYNNRSAEHIMTRVSRYFPPVVANFFSSQFRNGLRTDNARRWTDNDFLFAFVIYAQSPQCYAYLSKLVAFPPMESLNRWLDKVEVKPDAQIDASEFKNTVLGILLMKQGEVWCDKLAAGTEGQEVATTEHRTIEKVQEAREVQPETPAEEPQPAPEGPEEAQEQPVEETIVISPPEEPTELVVFQPAEDGTFHFEIPEEHQLFLQNEEGVQEEVVFDQPEPSEENEDSVENTGDDIQNLDTFDALAAAVADLTGSAL